MKRKFSTSWIASKQPRKQRKYLANAPLHLRQKFIGAHLSKSLREKYNVRNVPIRKGDEVIVMRGAFKKKRAKVMTVDLKKCRVTLENIQRSKKDGTKINVYLNPSNLQVQTLNLEDKKRIKSIEKTVKPKKEESKQNTDAKVGKSNKE